jgi:SAM-dependent methyltransferase
MPTREVAAQFDRISDVYDSTRDPVETDTLAALAAALRSVGVRRLLEVGIGTGRVGVPLGKLGLDITGVEPSRGMLAKARAKGLHRIVRGSGYQLPFRDGSFDAVLFVHVLHVLEEPARAIREGARVGTAGVYALVHPRSDEARADTSDSPRHLLREILAEQGYPTPDRSSPGRKERDLLARFPPDRLTVVSESDVTESVRARLERLELRGQRHLQHVPADAFARAIATAKERAGDRTVSYHRVEAIAAWTSGPVAADA